MKTTFLLIFSAITFCCSAQSRPQPYFRNPLDIPMKLVANFGELRTNHWHMGLDIRTQQRENLPVYAAADGYISTVSVDAMGFGRAIYINHPNGLTTVYAHLNNFEPKLQAWLKAQQYNQQRWAGKWDLSADLFQVKKGTFIAYSGNTGGSQGPHVHFEIRDTKTGKCRNPLLFDFPIPDAVPPTLQRLAVYDRNQSTYGQTPRMLGLKRAGANYTLTTPVLNVATDRIGFAISAIDLFTGYTNPNGIYCADVLVDGVLQSGFVLDSISYDETRYLNAQIDYRLKAGGGPYVQHVTPLPGEQSGAYKSIRNIVYLPDTSLHEVLIKVFDAAGNESQLRFNVKYTPNFFKTPYTAAAEQLVPNEVNVVERTNFELYTSEQALYDTVAVDYSEVTDNAAGSISAKHIFLDGRIPAHDPVTVRLKVTTDVTEVEQNRIIIISKAGQREVVQKATWRDSWISARFSQFGEFQAFLDTVPPTINAPGVGDTINLTRATRLVFNPKDNFKKTQNLRAELNGQWLLFSNDKGLAHIYQFDEHFPPGVHQLMVRVEDIAGNVTERRWWVRR